MKKCIHPSWKTSFIDENDTLVAVQVCDDCGDVGKTPIKIVF